MMDRIKWFEREFPPLKENGRLPSILERLAGTPVLLRSKAKGAGRGLLSFLADGEWTVKKEIGHLADLEPLWMARVEDFVERREILEAADLTNRKTFETDHDSASLDSLLSNFEDQRSALLRRIYSLDDDVFDVSITHPRLGTPMRLVDLAFFVAEHDDHHLARITSITQQYEADQR